MMYSEETGWVVEWNRAENGKNPAVESFLNDCALHGDEEQWENQSHHSQIADCCLLVLNHGRKYIILSRENTR